MISHEILLRALLKWAQLFIHMICTNLFRRMADTHELSCIHLYTRPAFVHAAIFAEYVGE